MAKPSDITAVILCGGLGTRLHSITNDQVPKPMVEVAGRPFLEYLLDYLIAQGVTHVVLAISHHKDSITRHFGSKYQSLTISYSIEEEPLGTGGAIKQALETSMNSKSKPVLILNGDTFVEYQLADLLHQMESTDADLVMTLKPLENTDRYGRVTVDNSDKITAFEEKIQGQAGNINTGVYLMKNDLLSNQSMPDKFSFEIDFMEKQVDKKSFYAVYVDSYFIDIGIPQDYHLANSQFQNKSFAANSL